MRNEHYNRNSVHSLFAAVREGNAQNVKRSLQGGVQINNYDPDGLTPLMIASGYGHSSIVKILLEEGANVHIVDFVMGATALHKAAQSGNAEVVRILLDHGIFIDQQSAVLGNTALMDAILYKQIEVVHILLDSGARTEIRNYWNQSAQDLASHEKISDLLDTLQDLKNKHQKKIAALKLIPAVKSGNIVNVKKALENDAWIEEEDLVDRSRSTND
ncbi:MAG: ankyrin repeat domain-containing protein [Chitinophagaceae bacterium]|nr:MAG: ankyrin repeat domain-containing protein [Chitinophagaceae bacterium]